MRTLLVLAGLALTMAWAGPAQAQSSSSSGLPIINNIIKFPSSMNLTIQPNITNNSPMDYRNQNAPIGGTIIRPPNNGSAFSLRLSQMFFQPARPNFISSTTTPGRSIFPTPQQMQAAAPSYFAPFQMYRAAPIQP
jgi:hypothetical protein